MKGTLYIVATPIGNLDDITLRALQTLRTVDLIACEDTRHTKKLLAHYQISKPTLSYHEHNERARTEELLDKLAGGMSLALVSDAGTPLISDPGFRLVSEAIERGIAVVPIPGVSAITTALAAAGLPIQEFTFVGFLPPRSSPRRAKLAELAQSKATLVIYEAPHRIKDMLADAQEVLGNRTAVLARELTKLHEEFLRGTLAELLAQAEQRALKGEMVLLISPTPVASPQGVPHSISEEVENLMRDAGLDRKAALKRAARGRGLSKSAAYRMLLAEGRNGVTDEASRDEGQSLQKAER